MTTARTLTAEERDLLLDPDVYEEVERLRALAGMRPLDAMYAALDSVQSSRRAAYDRWREGRVHGSEISEPARRIDRRARLRGALLRFALAALVAWALYSLVTGGAR